MINGIKTNEIGIVVWIHPKTGERHRLDGPAVIWKNGYRDYCINGFLYNINGPATIWKDGEKGYWIDDICYGYNNQKHQWLLISLKRKLIDKKKY